MNSKLLLTISSVLLLSGCSTLPSELKVFSEPVKVEIPVQPHPAPLSMLPTQWYVVNKDNFEEFKQRFTEDHGQFVFFAISVRDYENLALNMADIKRYIQQQQQIIIFYEEAVTGDNNNEPGEGKTDGVSEPDSL